MDFILSHFISRHKLQCDPRGSSIIETTKSYCSGNSKDLDDLLGTRGKDQWYSLLYNRSPILFMWGSQYSEGTGEFELNFPIHLAIDISHDHSPHHACHTNIQYRLYNLKNNSQRILAHCQNSIQFLVINPASYHMNKMCPRASHPRLSSFHSGRSGFKSRSDLSVLWLLPRHLVEMWFALNLFRSINAILNFSHCIIPLFILLLPAVTLPSWRCLVDPVC